LISHDDAFEGLQDQVIRVVAGEGERPSTIEGAGAPARVTPVSVAPLPITATTHVAMPELESPPVARKRPRRSKPATPK
jgi:hypothetical protein